MTYYPKPHQKSELPLSAGPELDRHNSCRPDEFPPYEPVPVPRVRVVADLKVVTNPLDFAFTSAIWFFVGMVGGYVLGFFR